MLSIFVNTREFYTPDEQGTYDYIVTLAFGARKRPGVVYTVTYMTRKPYGHQHEGTLQPGQSVALEDKMMFDVGDTSRA